MDPILILSLADRILDLIARLNQDVEDVEEYVLLRQEIRHQRLAVAKAEGTERETTSLLERADTLAENVKPADDDLAHGFDTNSGDYITAADREAGEIDDDEEFQS